MEARELSGQLFHQNCGRDRLPPLTASRWKHRLSREGGSLRTPRQPMTGPAQVISTQQSEVRSTSTGAFSEKSAAALRGHAKIFPRTPRPLDVLEHRYPDGQRTGQRRSDRPDDKA